MPNYNFVNSLDFKINAESNFIYNFYNSQESKNNDNVILNNNQSVYSYINLKVDISDKYDRRNITYNRFLETIVEEVNNLSSRDAAGNLYNMTQSEIALFNKVSDHEKDLLTLNLDITKNDISSINKFYQIPEDQYQSSINFITQNKKVNINSVLKEKFINVNNDNIFFTKSLTNSIDKFSLMFRQNIDEISRDVNNDENAFNINGVSYSYRTSSKISENFTPIKTTPVTQYTNQSGIFYYALTGVLVEKYFVEDKEENIFLKKDTKFFKTSIIPDNINEAAAEEFTKTISLDINDSAVKYGSEYFYIIYPVYAITLPKKNDYYLVETFLMCDYPYITENIVCKEFKRPTSPTNLMFRYINSEKCLNIEWAKPFERQGDVKGYQILKRKRLDEPYSLIGQIEFLEEDSFYERNTNITPSLIEKARYNKTYFIDKDFNTNEVQIYTICSIDARGQVSNYSEQIAVYYDYYSKKVIVDLVSTPGAPIHMPNLLIPRKTKFYDNEENIVSNTPYEKDVNKISLYITPEYNSILLGENEGETNIIADKYKFSIFKLENNQQVIKDINIKLQ